MVTNLKRSACFAALAATAALAVAQPSHATLMQAVFTGTINADLSGGAGGAGIFGLQEDQLIGQAFTMTFRYDTNLGTFAETSDSATLSGGATPGTVSPVLSANVQINGVTLSIPSVSSSNIAATDVSTGLGAECIQTTGASTRPSGPGQESAIIDGCLGNNSVPFSFDFSQPFSVHGGPVPFSEIGIFDQSTGQSLRRLDFRAVAHDLVVTRVAEAGAGVPEPTTWALLIAGFGLAGARLRARKPVLSPSSSCSS